jgi:hypothetical protein
MLGVAGCGSFWFGQWYRPVGFASTWHGSVVFVLVGPEVRLGTR